MNINHLTDEFRDSPKASEIGDVLLAAINGDEKTVRHRASTLGKHLSERERTLMWSKVEWALKTKKEREQERR